MKKAFFVLISVLLVLSLAACGAGKENGAQNNGGQNGQQQAGQNNESQDQKEPVVLKVGATAVPHAEILEQVVKPVLAKEGIELKVVVFQDYRIPNRQTFDGELDANYFQHIPYLEKSNKEEGFNLVPVAGVHIEPMGVYSNRKKNYTSKDQLPDNLTIAINNSAADLGRMLLLLENNGLLKLKEGVGTNATMNDIVENPKHIKFIQMDPAMVPRALDDPKVDLAIINTNFALQAGLNPVKDALFIEDADSPYVNILVARPDNKDSEPIQKLAKVLTSQKVKEFIEKKYNGAVVPAQKIFE